MVLPIFCRSLLSVTALLASVPSFSSAQVLLFDDFNSGSLNSQVWNEASWHLGRTQLGNPVSFGQEGTTDYLSMSLDSYNHT